MVSDPDAIKRSMARLERWMRGLAIFGSWVGILVLLSQGLNIRSQQVPTSHHVEIQSCRMWRSIIKEVKKILAKDHDGGIYVHIPKVTDTVDDMISMMLSFVP